MKIRFINWHKRFKGSEGLWNKWFKVERFWMGKIIEITVKHYTLVLDFRKNWLKDMVDGSKKNE